MAYGLTFISGQHYIYLRSKPQDRTFNLSLCHFWYLLGIAISATIIFPLQKNYNFDKEVVKYIGASVTITSLVIVILFRINDFRKIYNYKESLDIDVNRESDSNQIFELKYFEIRNPDAYVLVENRIASQKFSPEKRGYMVLIVMFIKLRNVILFYYPFIVWFYESINQSGNVNSLVVLIWLPVIGVTISTILLKKLDTKTIFEVSNIILLCSLLLASASLWKNSGIADDKLLRFSLLFVFAALGFAYSIPDNLVLDTANFLGTEIHMMLSFAVEMIAIGFIQWICITNGFVLNIALIIPVVVFAVLLFLYDWICMIKTFKQTILQISNTLNGFDYESNFRESDLYIS